MEEKNSDISELLTESLKGEKSTQFVLFQNFSNKDFRWDCIIEGIQIEDYMNSHR
jgi:hypothetical protein